jgi:hypothetical protein
VDAAEQATPQRAVTSRPRRDHSHNAAINRRGCTGHTEGLDENVLHHVSVDVCQPVVPAAVAIRQLLVVDAHEVEDGGVGIVGSCCAQATITRMI